MPFLFPLSNHPSVTIHSKTPITYNMLPTFHMKHFKPWAPPHRKPFSPHKSPNSSSPRTQTLPRPKPYHDSLPSTLPLPKHHLPARPPAEVCVHISANTRSNTPLSSQFQPREISIPPPSSPCSKDLEHGTTSLHDSAPLISGPDPIPYCDPQDDTSIPIEPPVFRGDFPEDSLSSPSISSSDECLGEFFRLLGAQDDIPIDPVILANHGPWEDGDLQLSIPQADSLISSEATCPYPDPPPILNSLPDHYRDSSERAGGQNSNIQTSDDPPHILDCQQLHPSQHETNPDASYPDGARGSHQADGQSKSPKRKMHQSDRQVHKRPRVPSTLPSGENSFTALRSHFVSLPLDERLQFLSWLFEGALPRCMPDSSPSACEGGDARAADHSCSPHEIEQNRRDCGEAQGSSRKRKKWTPEEVALLLKLREDESRPWSEVARLFSDHYPGRSPGAIQVYWSTTLKNKADDNNWDI
ncbi:hypothetical protein BDW59DRAFT_57789 [Aspergillus cavernicola]|uniref:Myb-like domain-containing protein n=1 Tax=Aspergillus cavernicola TaxID=176166 RepID=A0ABR4H7N7_9EURO